MSRINAVRQGEGIHRLSGEISDQSVVSDSSSPLEIQVVLHSPQAKMPEKAHPDDTGYDVYAAEITQSPHNANVLIYDTHVSARPPVGYGLFLFQRSSVSKYDLDLANAVGVVDRNYTGTLKFAYRRQPQADGSVKTYNLGEKVGQIIMLPIQQACLRQVEKLSETDRGSSGFGSTGV